MLMARYSLKGADIIFRQLNLQTLVRHLVVNEALEWQARTCCNVVGYSFEILFFRVGLDIWKANHGPHCAVRACFKVEENG